MLLILDIIFIVFNTLLFLPVSVFLIQAANSVRKYTTKTIHCSESISSVILVPAHNEALIIKSTLLSLQSNISSRDKILVIADNCTDETAEITRSMGIEVIERQDEHLRGKSYALDFGVKYLANSPPDVVVIVDADCEFTVGKFENLVKRCETINRPVQSLYLMIAPENTNVKTKVAEFAWLVKALVRPLGYQHLGLTCQLMGSGMAFPWKLISNVNLATGSIVEDLELGLECAELGMAPEFYSEVGITSEFPKDTPSENIQKTRWEHGHLSVILKTVPRLMWRAIVKKDIKFLAITADALVPPLALLVLILLVSIMSGIFLMFNEYYLPLTMSISLLVMFSLSIFISWFYFGRKTISLIELATTPFYIIKKLPIYFSFIFKKQQKWIKTKRD